MMFKHNIPMGVGVWGYRLGFQEFSYDDTPE